MSGLSALVDKKRLAAHKIGSISDILAQMESRNRPGQSEPEDVTTITLGTVRSSFTYRQLSMATDKIGNQVYQRVYHDSKNNQADTREEGITRVLTTPYALIQVGHRLAQRVLHCRLLIDLTHRKRSITSWPWTRTVS